MPGRYYVLIVLGLMGMFGGAGRAAQANAWYGSPSDLPTGLLLLGLGFLAVLTGVLGWFKWRAQQDSRPH